MAPRRPGKRTRLSYLAAGVACLALLAACGTRVSDERVVQASQGGPAVVTNVPGGAAGPAAGAPSAPGATDPGTGLGPAATDDVQAPVAGQGGQGNQGGQGGGNQGAGGQDAGGQGAANQPGANQPAGNQPAGNQPAGNRGGGNASAASEGCTEQGPPIILGQVVSASGIIGANVGSAIPVLGAWAQHINATGGIACHPVQLFSQDDASDPGKASSAVQDLVKNRKAIGLVGNFIPLSISGFKSALNDVKVPAVGGDLFSTTWWNDPLFYPVGTHVDANAVGSTQSVAKSGADKVAVIYCIEAAVCPPYKDAIKRNAASSGYEVVYDVQVTITAPDYTTQCQAAKNAGATQISMIVEGSGVSRIARSCAGIGYFPKFAVASLGATFDTADENVQRMSATIASAAADWFSGSSKGQKEFQDAMKRYAPSLELDPTAPLAWADGMMVKKAIEKLGAAAEGVEITPAMLRKGLSMIKDETLDGMIKPTSFSPSMGNNPKTACYFSDVFSGSEGTGDAVWRAGSSGCLKGLGGPEPASNQIVERSVEPGAATSSLPAATRRSRERA